MPGMNFRDPYGVDPETYGGVPGMLRRFVQQQGVEPGSNASAGPEYNSDSTQGGLLGRLLALQAEQSQYQPISENSGSSPFASPNPDLRQVSRMPNDAPPAMPGSPAPQAFVPQTQAQYEADQAQQAREAAAARLARGVRSLARAGIPPPDPADIAKSAGIGLANGAINAAGLPGDLLTGFGYLPDHFVENPVRRALGYPDLPANTPGWVESFTSAALRHSVENYTGEFYQPKTRIGRFAETIGEMVPMVLGGEGLGVRLGFQKADATLRQLPWTVIRHAVAPGIAVQSLEEALPDSQAGQTLQKAYPVLRRAIPAALAAKRYLSRRVVPQ
jgi:hypothetical protein